MSVSSTSFRAEPELLSALDGIAKEMGRSRNWAINKAVQDFIEHQTWFKRQVKEGIEAADSGDFATDEEMARVFGKFGA
jgi:predicted transcriptional regulator